MVVQIHLQVIAQKIQEIYSTSVGASINWNPIEDLTLDGTIRSENYSDFGNAFVWKVSGAYTINDKYTLRSSLSTGFRAPTLHQIYTQKAQYSFVPGQGIQVGGLVNNVSSQAGLLGIPIERRNFNKLYIWYRWKSE
jgi:outer membrane cobalamin receptor